MDGKIKPLTIEDYDEIIRVWSDAGLPFKPKGRDSRESMAKEMQLEVAMFFGYYDGDRLIGVGIANYDGRRGWINRVAVDPDYRGRGIAGQLIATCEEFLYSIGAIVICALIEDINEPSISAFQKSGYSTMDEIKYFSKRRSWDD